MYKAVIFDVDGVLTYFKSAWQRLHRILGVDAEVNKALYQGGYINYEEWAVADVELWRSAPRHIAEAYFAPREGFDELCQVLRRLGLFRAAISAGVGYTRRLARCFDEFVVNDLIYSGNVVEGVRVAVTNSNKGDIARELLERRGIAAEEAIAVGDSETDLPLFRAVRFPIAFNPANEEVARAAKAVIRSRRLTPLAKYLAALISP